MPDSTWNRYEFNNFYSILFFLTVSKEKFMWIWYFVRLIISQNVIFHKWNLHKFNSVDEWNEKMFQCFWLRKMWTKQNICLQLAINKFTNCMALFYVCAFIVMFANEYKIDYENISWFMQGNYVESNVEFQCGISLRIETRWVIESQAWANYRWRFKRTNFMSTFDICVWNFQILSTFACCALNKTNKYLLPWFCFRTFVRLLSLHFPWVFFSHAIPQIPYFTFTQVDYNKLLRLHRIRYANNSVQTTANSLIYSGSYAAIIAAATPELFVFIR